MRTKLVYNHLYFHFQSGSGPDMQNYLNKLYDTNVRSRFKFKHNNIHPCYQQYTLHLKIAPTVPRAPHSGSLGLKSLSRVKNKKQLNATYYFIALLIGSTCFGHYYAHHQELTTMMLITTLVVSFLVCCMLEVSCG